MYNETLIIRDWEINYYHKVQSQLNKKIFGIEDHSKRKELMKFLIKKKTEIEAQILTLSQIQLILILARKL